MRVLIRTIPLQLLGSLWGCRDPEPYVVHELTVMTVGEAVQDPADTRIRPELASAMTVGICGEHFPAGSVARSNIEAAFSRYDEASGLDIQMDFVELEHQRQAQLYTSTPPGQTIRIDYVFEEEENHIPRGQSMGPTCASGTFLGLSVDARDDDGALDWYRSTELNDYGVIALNGACYSEDPDSRDVPLTDTVAHELGHSFGLPHINRHQEPYLGYSSIMNKTQGGESELTAYDLAYLSQRYPGDLSELDRPDWRVSDYWLVEEERFEGSPGAEEPAPDMEIGEDRSGALFDCATGETPILEATIYDLSPAAASGRLGLRIEGYQGTLWEEEFDLDEIDPGDFVEYHLRAPLDELPDGEEGWRLVVESDEAERSTENNVGPWHRLELGGCR